MRIVIAGGSGLIGSALRAEAAARGHEVGLLVRRDPAGPQQWRWRPEDGWVPDEALAWADGVVNLSGASIGRVPWTRAYRRELVESRLHATQTLVNGIGRSARPPAVLVNGSAVGFYGDRPSEVLDERSSVGTGFLARLCQRWEFAAGSAVARVAMVRTGLVLADGGALAPLILATRVGAAGRIGSGEQIWPWIALTDEVGAILHVLEHEEIAGPVNLVAPAASTSSEVTRTLAQVMHRPHLFTLPARLLRLPMGEMADELLLLSQQIEPSVLESTGYRFEHPELGGAIETALEG